MATKNNKLVVLENEITLINQGMGEFISLTDIAMYRNSDEPYSVINKWMRNRGTIEFIGLWEKLYNPDFRIQAFSSSN